jgi:hypothetical protein
MISSIEGGVDGRRRDGRKLTPSFLPSLIKNTEPSPLCYLVIQKDDDLIAINLFKKPPPPKKKMTHVTGNYFLVGEEQMGMMIMLKGI